MCFYNNVFKILFHKHIRKFVTLIQMFMLKHEKFNIGYNYCGYN
jgi:hypothetical protein